MPSYPAPLPLTHVTMLVFTFRRWVLQRAVAVRMRTNQTLPGALTPEVTCC